MTYDETAVPLYEANRRFRAAIRRADQAERDLAELQEKWEEAESQREQGVEREDRLKEALRKMLALPITPCGDYERQLAGATRTLASAVLNTHEATHGSADDQ